MKRCYQALLRLYPADYRDAFAAEMSTAFETAAAERSTQGPLSFLCFLAAELIGLVTGACSEWVAKLTTDRAARGRCLPDLRMMRPPGVARELWFAGAHAHSQPASLPDEVPKARENLRRLVEKHSAGG